MAELLYYIILGCESVPNEVASGCVNDNQYNVRQTTESVKQQRYTAGLKGGWVQPLYFILATVIR